MLSFFPRGILDEILNLIESASEGFPSYYSIFGRGSPKQGSCEINAKSIHFVQYGKLFSMGSDLNFLFVCLFVNLALTAILSSVSIEAKGFQQYRNIPVK